MRRYGKRIPRRTVGRMFGVYRGYDAYTRHFTDAEAQQKRRIEARARRRLGLGRFDPWPLAGEDNHGVLYFTVDEVARARNAASDAILCGRCLNARPWEVVVEIESAVNYEEHIACDHCGAHLAGESDRAVAA